VYLTLAAEKKHIPKAAYVVGHVW